MCDGSGDPPAAALSEMVGGAGWDDTAELLLVSRGDCVAESSHSASSSTSSSEDLPPNSKPRCFLEACFRGFEAGGPNTVFRCNCVCDKLRASALADLFLRRWT